MDYLIPRLLCAFFSGLIISQTGSLIQMGTRNILASPSTLGFDGLGILWILALHSGMLIFGLEGTALQIFSLGLPLFIFIGFFFARSIKRSQNIEKLILLGLTFNLFVGAIFSLWQFLFLAFNLPFPTELWFGHFRFANAKGLIILALVEMFIVGGWLLLRKEFQLFSLGRGVARNWKLRENELFIYLFVAVGIGTFCVVSLFGAFSFLGLVFPIMSRKLWFKKFDLKGEMVIGGIMNGLILMLIDFICYNFPVYGAEIPVGLIATAVGALSLITLLWKSDRHLEILAKPLK